MSRHVIETLQWTCHSTERQPVLAQQSMSDFLHGPGARMLETVLDRLSVRGEVWRIDQLEIDLGQVPADTDADGWARLLELALDTALRRLRQDGVDGPRNDQITQTVSRAEDRELDHFLYYLEHGRLHWSMPPLTSSGMADWLARLTKQIGPRLWPALLRLPHADRTLSRLSHITPCHGLHALLVLRHGELAHALELLDDTVLEPLRAQGRLSAYQLARVKQAWRVAGLQALWGQGGSTLGVARIQRLLATLGSSLLAHLGANEPSRLGVSLDLASPAWATSGLQRSLLLGVQSRLLGQDPEARHHHLRRSQASADGVGTSDGGSDHMLLPAAWHESLRQFALAHQSDPVVREAGLGLSDLQIYLMDYSLAHLSETERVPQDHVAWQQVWNSALRALADEDAGHVTQNFGDPTASPSASGSATQRERPKVRHNRNSDGTVSPADDHPDNEAIYIANAGLVLLANYTPRLFDMLGLLKGDAFLDERARHRAVHCLVYLSDGHTDTEEHEWVLNKLLCGVPVEEPVPPGELPDAIKPALDSLLQAVITHWHALGSTSPDGLRQTFLRRIGRLVEHDAYEGEHWRLKVQPGPFDLLLDRLPWGYGTIKLPWMKGAIHVDWR
ncbi:contractile injection system tape measure protein [Dyella silvae]|uniref:contractile injection system tape measure protein n=1 Tax=Dyella silvae TaxID=2994424 RepID=UPI002263EFBB|nr:contractile injection system tape measure protein [Dyella silvae]